MDAYELLSLIDTIAATSSRLEKESLLKTLAEDELGRFVLTWAYDPMITFGITAGATEPEGKLNIKFRISLVEPLLRRLANRELTGNAAQREVAECMAAFDKEGARLLFLILSKDLKCGIAESTINQAIPGLVPVFAVMRAHPYEAKKVKSWPMKAEFKLDGQRNTLLVRNGKGGFYTRSGKVVPALDFLVRPVITAAAAMLQNPDISTALFSLLTNGAPPTIREAKDLSFMLDGEAMMGLFADTGALRRKEAEAKGAELHLYDIMSFADFDATGSVGLPLEDRRKLLAEFVSLSQKHLAGTEHAETIQIVPQFFVNSDEEVQAFFERARGRTLAAYLARGNKEREAALLPLTIDAATGKPKVLEGAMIKNPKGLYDKKKSNGWLKVKAEETEDIRITGAYRGSEHTELENTLGGLQFTRSFNGNEVRVDVGGGYAREQRDELWALWLEDCANGTLDEKRVNGKIWITLTPNPGYTPKLVGRLGEIEFHEVTPDGSLRHPRFVRFRDDKDGEIEDKEAYLAAAA